MKLEVGTTRAVEWILSQIQGNPNADRLALIDEASTRFSLTPLEAEFLYGRFLRKDG